MGKKKDQSAGLGRRIIKSRFGKHVNRSVDSFLHTSELPDGYDWGRLNLQSVTEQSNLDEFLATAELAGTEFVAEKLNVSIVDPGKNSGLLTVDELSEVRNAQHQHRQLLRIPRRPAWNTSMRPEDLDAQERQAFLEWRRDLSELQEMKHIVMTPYEKNLDFWRQLWRVIERSDVVVQIVDARNPLLFRCVDLEKYVQEVNPGKVNLVLVNKADHLTARQRELWADYFSKAGVLIAYWSALAEANQQESNSGQSTMIENQDDADNSDDIDESDEIEDIDDLDETGDKHSNEEMLKMPDENDLEHFGQELPSDTGSPAVPSSSDDVISADEVKRIRLSETVEKMPTVSGDSEMLDCDVSADISRTRESRSSTLDDKLTADNYFGSSHKKMTDAESSLQDTSSGSSELNPVVSNSSKVLNGEELLELFRSLHTTTKVNENYTTIGMVGYPNVGKSSTINAILKMKKVPVSATPGRTKHFQTLYMDADLMLCDCPGLVFPSFVTTKAELVVNGVLPIDQMRDHVPPVSLVCQRLSRSILEKMYGVNLPSPGECEDPLRSPTSAELLNAYAAMRGFMTSRGVPDNSRASRYILKDYVNGKLLYCHPPPGLDEASFQSEGAASNSDSAGRNAVAAGRISDNSSRSLSKHPKVDFVESKIDVEFFRKSETRVHSKGVHGVAGFTRATHSGQHVSSTDCGHVQGSSYSLTEKPWRKHNNCKKKEKSRRVHKSLDDV